jgi:hypothetical protein
MDVREMTMPSLDEHHPPSAHQRHRTLDPRHTADTVDIPRTQHHHRRPHPLELPCHHLPRALGRTVGIARREGPHRLVRDGPRIETHRSDRRDMNDPTSPRSYRGVEHVAYARDVDRFEVRETPPIAHTRSQVDHVVRCIRRQHALDPSRVAQVAMLEAMPRGNRGRGPHVQGEGLTPSSRETPKEAGTDETTPTRDDVAPRRRQDWSMAVGQHRKRLSPEPIAAPPHTKHWNHVGRWVYRRGCGEK